MWVYQEQGGGCFQLKVNKLGGRWGGRFQVWLYLGVGLLSVLTVPRSEGGRFPIWPHLGAEGGGGLSGLGLPGSDGGGLPSGLT